MLVLNVLIGKDAVMSMSWLGSFGLPSYLSLFVCSNIPDLSQELVGVLSWMMHPDPASRPSVDQLLEHPGVRCARIKRPLVRGAVTVVSQQSSVS